MFTGTIYYTGINLCQYCQISVYVVHHFHNTLLDLALPLYRAVHIVVFHCSLLYRCMLIACIGSVMPFTLLYRLRTIAVSNELYRLNTENSQLTKEKLDLKSTFDKVAQKAANLVSPKCPVINQLTTTTCDRLLS